MRRAWQHLIPGFSIVSHYIHSAPAIKKTPDRILPEAICLISVTRLGLEPKVKIMQLQGLSRNGVACVHTVAKLVKKADTAKKNFSNSQKETAK